MPFYRQEAKAFDGERAMQHVTLLTDRRLSGRALGSSGMDLAAIYIAQQFAQFAELGLQPAGEANTFFQRRSHAFETLDSPPKFEIKDGGPPLTLRVDFAAFPGYAMTAGSASSKVTVVMLGDRPNLRTGGYYRAYPDLERADFSNEIVLAISPWDANTLSRKDMQGMLVVASDPSQLAKRYTLSGRSGKRLTFTGKFVGEETPSLWISETAANRLLANSGYTVADLRQRAAELAVSEVFQLPLDIEASMSVSGTIVDRWPVKHVLGLLPGTSGMQSCRECLGHKLVVVLAQYDSPPVDLQGPYPAANDNASGVAVLLEAIRTLQDTAYQPYRSILFVAYSGEGQDGGELVNEPDVSRFLQARTGFTNFELEAIVRLRGVGGGAGDRLEISAGGSLRLAELFEDARVLISASFTGAKMLFCKAARKLQKSVFSGRAGKPTHGCLTMA